MNISGEIHKRRGITNSFKGTLFWIVDVKLLLEQLSYSDLHIIFFLNGLPKDFTEFYDCILDWHERVFEKKKVDILCFWS